MTPPPNDPHRVGRILVVDDESLYAEMLYSILRQHHYPADMTDDPVRAKEMIQENDYSLLVTDYQMPNMTGVQLVDAIREIGFTLPVIIISGMMHTPELQRAVNMGITTVLQKPTGTQNFLSHVNRYVPRPEPRTAVSSVKKRDPRSPLNLRPRAGNQTTYPQIQNHVPGSSPRTKKTLQRLWDRSKITNQIFLTCPKGGDALHFSKELACWKGYGDVSLNFVHIDKIAENNIGVHFDELIASKNSSELVVVDCRGDNLDGQAAALSEHIKSAHKYSSGSRELSFVYWFESDQFAALEGHFDQDLYTFCKTDLIHIAPLNERLLDLASYCRTLTRGFSKKLKRSDRKTMTPEAMHHLLQYPWPGNYAELGLVLWKAVAMKEDGPITLEQLLSALTVSGDFFKTDPIESSPLEAFLSLKQQLFIDRTGSGDESSLQLDSLNIESLGELMYPEIIQIGATDAA